MGELYEWGENLFQDIIMTSLLSDVDILDVKFKESCLNAFRYFLENYLNNPKDVIYLDFDIINDGVMYKLVGRNMLSALWLSGIHPDNTHTLINEDKCIVDDIEYSYDKKKHELTYKIINE